MHPEEVYFHSIFSYDFLVSFLFLMVTRGQSQYSWFTPV